MIRVSGVLRKIADVKSALRPQWQVERVGEVIRGDCFVKHWTLTLIR
jgi:hypothetical protein